MSGLAENDGMTNDTENARTELVALLEQAFFKSDATTGLECAIEATTALLANRDVVLRAMGGTHDWHDDDQDVWWFPVANEGA